MKLLLDTHTLLWWWNADSRLSSQACEHISEANNEIVVSAASAWEIATKFRLGKLLLAESVLPRYHDLLAADGFLPLAITTEHALLSGNYTHPHRDPFDRMLAAQAELEGLPIISRDKALVQFGAKLIW
jgi:PIN domain nuclease of toxin-antitoxin system